MRSNEGETFTDEHHDVFHAYLATHFGGFTRLPGEAGGGWMEDGTFYPDTMRVYMVAVGGLLADGKALTLLAETTKSHYRQKAVFLRYLGQAEVL